MICSRESSFFQEPSCYIYIIYNSLCSSISIILRMLHTKNLNSKFRMLQNLNLLRGGANSPRVKRDVSTRTTWCKRSILGATMCTARRWEIIRQSILKMLMSLQWLNWTPTGAWSCLLSVVSGCTNQWLILVLWILTGGSTCCGQLPKSYSLSWNGSIHPIHMTIP